MTAVGRVHVAPNASWVLWVGIGMGLLMQALLAYAIPLTVFTKAPWWAALDHSVRETLRYPMSTLVVVGIPSAVAILFAVLATPGRVAFWMTHDVPEIAFLWVAARLIVSTVTDAVLTVAIAHLWWIHRASQAAVHPVTVGSGSSAAPARHPALAFSP